MEIIDIHAHVYEKVAGITQGAPMTSEKLGKVRIGNRISQFLPPAFENTSSPVETLIGYMEWCGIDRALLMPNPYYGYHNDYFIESVKKYPEKLRAVALVDLLKGEKAAKELADIYDTTELFGFKVETDSTFQCAPGKRLADEDLLPVWDCVNQYHQPVFIHLFTDEDIREMKKLIDTFPNITWVICHMGADACFKRENMDNFEVLLQWVKSYPNVYMDTSTVPVYYDDKEEYPFPTSVKVIEKAWETAGAEKLMWASDYPGMLMHATMKELINLVKTQCHIPERDKELIMGQNAKRLFFGGK